MIAEGLQKLVELIGDVAELEPDGGDWVPNWYKRVEHESVPAFPTVTFHTLDGIANYYEKNVDRMAGNDVVPFFLVKDPRSVLLMAPHGEPGFGKRRHLLAVAEVVPPQPMVFQQWVSVESALIEIQSCCTADWDAGEVCKLLGNVRDEVIRTQRDDGVTQVATVQESVGIDATMPVPTHATLALFRTFPEVGQPMSAFLLRLRRTEIDGVQARLFLADNERWRIKAVESVAAYLRGQVSIPVLA